MYILWSLALAKKSCNNINNSRAQVSRLSYFFWLWFAVLLCRCVSIMGCSWECGRLLPRICHNDFWFCGVLTGRWSRKSSGITGYMNALGHSLDFRRRYSDLTKIHSSVFIPFEIYIQRVKRHLSKKNKIWLERSFEYWLSELSQLLGYNLEEL